MTNYQNAEHNQSKKFHLGFPQIVAQLLIRIKIKNIFDKCHISGLPQQVVGLAHLVDG